MTKVGIRAPSSPGHVIGLRLYHPSEMNPLWTDLASRAGVNLPDAQHAQLSRYLDLLFEANARMNLTRITDRAQAELQHVADALTLLPHLPPDAHRFPDVGSGGGVPGIPLAIVRPDATVLFIELSMKQDVILKDAVEALSLRNASVSEWRAVDVTHGNSRESFDVAVARAVAMMDCHAEWSLPLVKKG